MKKGLLFIVCLLIGIGSSSALTLNEDGSYTNAKNVKISSEQYGILSNKFTDTTIDLLDAKKILYYSDAKSRTIQTEYTITTDIISDGKIIDSITIPATETEAKKVTENDNIHVLSDMKLHDVSKMIVPYYMPEGGYDVEYSTSSKKISLGYGEYNEGWDPSIIIDVEWFKIPMIKKYDIIAARWDQSMPTSNIDEFEGYQKTYDKNGNVLEAKYDLGSDNQKITTNGFGQIMNIFDSASDSIEMSFVLHFKQNVGSTVYGSYQHARNSNITLSQAKSYSIKSGGLGNVIYFSNSTVRNYYDGMQGLSTVAHFA